MYFLLEYDRALGDLRAERTFSDRHEALEARLDAEDRYRAEPAMEVVVLGAASREQLLVTHGRYFLALSELAQRLVHDVR